MPPTTDFFNMAGDALGNQEPGYTQLLYIAPKERFTAIAAAVGGPGPNELIITGDHTFGVSAGFNKIYCQIHTTESESDAAGENGALTPDQHTLKVTVPGDKEDIQVMINAYRNRDLIVLAQNADGTFHQFGDTLVPASLSKIKWMTGTTKGGKRAGTFEILGMKRYTYQGDITVQA